MQIGIDFIELIKFGNKMKKAILTLMLVLGANFAHANDAKLSWDNATVFAPQSNEPIKITDIKTAQPLPVVVYLHGCTGIVDWHDYDWGRTLSSSGYIVVMPDSMARKGRTSNCSPSRQTGSNSFPQAYEYRQQEISYDMDQIQQNNWANKNKVFLMGHSEGGIAVASSTHNMLRGNVILAWTCTFRNNPTLDGIKSPKEIPILAVAAKYDEWRVGKASEGRCADKADGRNLIQIDLNGREHATTKYSESKPAVLKFLQQF